MPPSEYTSIEYKESRFDKYSSPFASLLMCPAESMIVSFGKYIALKSTLWNAIDNIKYVWGKLCTYIGT